MASLRCLVFFLAFVAINASKVRYDGNALFSVTPFEEAHYQFLSQLEENHEIDIWNEIRRNASVHIMLNQTKSSWLVPVLESLNMSPKVMIKDVQKVLDEEDRVQEFNARAAVSRGIQDSFYNYDQLSIWLQDITAAYPNLAKLESIGRTYENRNIWLVKITAPTGTAKKTAFLDFGIHAREWIAPATGAYMINEFLTTFAAGGDAATILRDWVLYIVPCLNPDGYAYSHSTQRLWRKNRKPVGRNCYGVDLNRNFGYQWNTGGSSADVCSDTFHGGSPMSENEAKAVQNYMTGKSWTTYVTFHSYGQWWFTNWGYTSADPPSLSILTAKAQIGVNAIKSVNGRSYVIGPSAKLLYVASGGSEDWTRGTLNILYSYCLELPPTGGTGFIAPVSEIKKTGGETYTGMVAYFKSF